jgi:hypothetical protein
LDPVRAFQLTTISSGQYHVSRKLFCALDHERQGGMEDVITGRVPNVHPELAGHVAVGVRWAAISGSVLQTCLRAASASASSMPSSSRSNPPS